MSTAAPSEYSREDLARELLLYKMREYSQDYNFASWLVDLEFELWYPATAPADSVFEQAKRLAIRECRALSNIAGGWWVYQDASSESDEQPVFISLERWSELLREHEARSATKAN